MKHYLIYLPLFLFFSFSLAAQHSTTSEAAVNLEAMFIDGLREKQLGNYDKAAGIFEDFLEKDPNNAAAAYVLSQIYDTLGKSDKAMELGAKAVELDKNNNWYKIYLANLYQKNDRDIDAAALYEELVKQEPHNLDYYRQWAYHLVRAGKPADAIKVYNELEKKMGVNEETTRHKHTLYMGMGDYKKAAKEIEKLIERFPDKTQYRHLLATFYEQINDKEKARETYRQILELDPEDARAKIALAEEAKGNDDLRFLQSLKPVFENPSTDLDTKIKELIPYVQELSSTQDQDLGNSLLALAAILDEVHPGSAKVQSLMGDVLYYSGQKDTALQHYLKCLEIDDTVWQVWEQTLYLLHEKGAYEELARRAEYALDIFPNQATAYYYYGVAKNELGDAKEALNAFQQALIMASRNQSLRFNILVQSGKAYCSLKQYSKADNAFNEALEMSNRNAVALLHYCHCLSERKDQLDKAMEIAEELIGVAQGDPDAEAAMAEVHYQQSQYDKAAEWLEMAMEHGGSNDPFILERFGDVQFKLGHQTEALEYWKKALENGGQSSSLERKIQEGKLHE
ncbi:MAG: tetratricopeptide repeat protein [Saprospiraceae bacterium]